MEKINGSAFLGAGVAAVSATMQNKNVNVDETIGNNYGIALNGELKDPEITGTDEMDIHIDFPFGGGMTIKAKSQVTSSVKAQEALNEDARKNLSALTEFLTKVGMAIVPAVTGIKEMEREQSKKSNDDYNARRQENQEIDLKMALERQKHDHEMEMLRKQQYHEQRMADKKMDDEYNALFGDAE